MADKSVSYKGIITKIYDDIRPKSNGKSFILCEAKFTTGPLTNKTYFAQRTLGAKKAQVNVSDEVTLHMSVVDGNPFFEISTGSNVTDKAEILAALGL